MGDGRSNATLRIRCACGWELTGPVDEVVEATREHGRRLHNMVATRAEVLAMALDPSGASSETSADVTSENM